MNDVVGDEVINLRREPPLEQERVLAKEHWGLTDSQRKEYTENNPPFYARALVRTIKALQPSSVLEMGCNAGRNLRLLRESVSPEVSLRGFDVNSSSIEFGRDRWGLDLVAGDEFFLDSLSEQSVEVLFTVSVLDHVPDLHVVLRSLMRVVKHFIVLIEPYPEQGLEYLDSFKESGIVRQAMTTETPYSYLYNYLDAIPPYGFDNCLDIPMPTYTGNWGPLYRLNVFKRTKDVSSLAPRVNWKLLTDEIVFDAVFASYRNQK